MSGIKGIRGGKRYRWMTGEGSGGEGVRRKGRESRKEKKLCLNGLQISYRDIYGCNKKKGHNFKCL